jgi:hypothetical protein
VKKREDFDIPDGTIAHLTRECGGNVHDRHVIDVMPGSFDKETNGADPPSGVYDNQSDAAMENPADLETDSRFLSAGRKKEEGVPHTRSNWVCQDFKESIVPTRYTVHSRNAYGPDGCHLGLWLVETSADGESRRVVAREEDNKQLNRSGVTGIFAVAGGGESGFIRLHPAREHRQESHRE